MLQSAIAFMLRMSVVGCDSEKGLLECKGMSTARSPIAFVTSVIAIGVLLYSPLCSLSCAVSDCFLLPKTKIAKQNKQSGHCHKQKDSEQPPTESHSSAPQRHGDSGDCPAHSDATALLSSAVKAPTAVQQGLTLVAALPETSYVSFYGFAARFTEGRPFRLPPKRAVISVYRI